MLLTFATAADLQPPLPLFEVVTVLRTGSLLIEEEGPQYTKWYVEEIPFSDIHESF
jgi:hypothetical protein